MKSAMKKQLAILLLTSTLAGCGASSNSAPIVYGTQPASAGRIYNSPADVYLAPGQAVQQAPSEIQTSPYEGDVYASNAYRAQSQSQILSRPQPQPIRATPYSRPAALTPVTQTVYSEPLPPAPTYVAETQPAAAPAPQWSSASPKLMTVRPGDTVYAISRRTGASPKAIIAENRLAPPYALRVGQTVRVPNAQAPVSRAKVANTITRSAPVRQTVASGALHRVQAGDTLYSISRATGSSVSAIAQANGLRPPYSLSVGDQLRLPVGASTSTAVYKSKEDVADLTRNVSYNRPAAPKKPESLFEWPVKGAVIGQYGSGELGRRNDGVNIAAPVGTPVRAAADGEIVYRGSELDGYGNLLLIKHNDGFVTAYAHNDVMLVRKGQKVRQGQVIAKVGQTGSAPEPQLHFEIRQNLKSVDPLAFLQ